MRRAGVESVRLDVPWSLVEPERGVLRFDLLDPMVQASAQHRMDLLPMVWTTPRWASQQPDRRDFAIWSPANASDYAAFLQQLIHRYGPRGSFWREHPRLPKRPIRAWQISNKPSARYWWETPDYRTSYVALLKAAYPAVHAADRRAKVVMAGLASFLSPTSGKTTTNWEDVRAFYRNGVRRYFDVAAVHAFSYRVKDVIRTVEKFRAVMRHNGDRRKPIYTTEVSWPALNPRLPSSRHLGFEVSPRGQPNDSPPRIAASLPTAVSASRARIGSRGAPLTGSTRAIRCPARSSSSASCSEAARSGPTGRQPS